jgi:hypothetical protein
MNTPGVNTFCCPPPAQVHQLGKELYPGEILACFPWSHPLQCGREGPTNSAVECHDGCMPKPAQRVLMQLQELTRLPARVWRMHPSDMPHGKRQPQ